MLCVERRSVLVCSWHRCRKGTGHLSSSSVKRSAHRSACYAAFDSDPAAQSPLAHIQALSTNSMRLRVKKAIEPAALRMEGGAWKVASMTASQVYEWRASVLPLQRCRDSWAMVAGKVIACERRVTYYEAVVKPGNERACDMLQLLDKVEEKHLASDATVAPGAMAMGQREAMKHVGMVPLRSTTEKSLLRDGLCCAQYLA